MEARDVDAVHAVAVRAFDDLNRRFGDPPAPPAPIEAARIRLRRLLATDPDGAWVAARGDGEVAGAALALVREGLWGLSLLVVDPGAQSGGVGRELLGAAWEYGDGARGHVILASRDTRALRAYAALGLALHPAMAARGRPRGIAAPPEVRPWEPGDEATAAAADQHVRNTPHGADLEALRATGAELLVLPERGYVVVTRGTVKLLAARDDEAAAALLRAALATAEEEAAVEWLTSAQGWAVRPCLEAGLELHALGAVFTAGDIGRFAPYLPSGAYL